MTFPCAFSLDPEGIPKQKFKITPFLRMGTTAKVTKLKLLKSLFIDIWYFTSGMAFYKYFNKTSVLLQRQCTGEPHCHERNSTK